MKKSYILFIDSGIGGLSTLYETIKVLNNNYIYFADTKFVPYGSKKVSFLHKRLSEIIVKMRKKYDIKIVVLACNTATTTSIKFLRKKFPSLKIIGTEPAVKVAIDNGFKKPAVIATPQTIRHLKARFKFKFKTISCPALATCIENNLTSNTLLNNFKLNKILYNLTITTQNNDCIVLGCTHYTFIKDKLSRLINKPMFNGNQGVARKILQGCPENHKNIKVKIVISSKKSKELQKYKKILNQILAKQIKLW